MKDRDEARHWIKLRHTGQNDGAGIVPWGSDETTRFGVCGGELEIQSQILDFLENRGVLTVEDRRKVPASSIKRVFGTPEVRDKCAIGWEDNKLVLLANADRIAKALLYVVEDFTKRGKKTDDIYTRPKRIAYANSIPASVVVKPTQKPTAATAAEPKLKSKPAAKAKRAKPRDVLIPSNCILRVVDARIADIEDELRRMSLEGFPNGVSVLSRVFLELSVDHYIDTAPLAIQPNAKLRVKLQDVVNDLVAKTKLTQQQARPLRTALQKNSFLCPSLDTMNDYVHTADVFPAPIDLRANWDTLQPFFVAIWTP